MCGREKVALPLLAAVRWERMEECHPGTEEGSSSIVHVRLCGFLVSLFACSLLIWL